MIQLSMPDSKSELINRFWADAVDTANNAKLIAALGDAREPAAHFYCALVLLRHPEDPAPLVATGRWDGRILGEPRGDGGFGYDPLFLVPGAGCTAAELPAAEKNRLSHRGQAMAMLLESLRAEV